LHVKGEEHPLFQVPMVGSNHQVLRNVSLPGIDALERDPSNNFFPRQAASCAAQFGSGRCMGECFGGAGWGATPEDLERYLLWLGRNGITDFVLHLSQYRLDSATIRDWPPSQPLHLTWREVFPHVIERVRRGLANPPLQEETLVIAPYRGIMAEYNPEDLLRFNIHDGSGYALNASGLINDAFLSLIRKLDDAGVRYGLCDEQTFEDFGAVVPGEIQVGNARYAKLITAEGVRLTEYGRNMLEAAVRWGNVLSETALHRESLPLSVRAERREERVVPIRWRLLEFPSNDFVLEPKASGNGAYICRFEIDCEGSPLIEVRFADSSVTEVMFNGVSQHPNPAEEGCSLSIRACRKENELRFRAETSVQPVISLRGHFLVASKAPFENGPNGTLRTAGPFVLRDPVTPECPGELVEQGFPFLYSPLSFGSDVPVPVEHRRSKLKLEGIVADAVRIRCEEMDLGWAWGPDWEIEFPEWIAPGEKTLSIQLVPSAYNFFGPHHHRDGDRRLVSPQQFAGRKNFADDADAPECTHVKEWHFRPLRLPTSVRVFVP
jgi:hypothetical protein